MAAAIGRRSRARGLLEQGEIVGMFPQGTAQPYRDRPFRRGAARLALETGAPIVPVCLVGTERVLRPHRVKVGLPKVSVLVGRPIPVEQRKPTIVAANELIGRVETAVLELRRPYGEPDHVWIEGTVADRSGIAAPYAHGMATFRKRTPMPVSAESLYGWHARQGAIERLTPPWVRTRLLVHEGIEDGARAVLEVRKGPLRRRWVAVHRDHVPGRRFADEQASGPFAEWHHTHRFVPDGLGSSFLEDEVQYRLPLGALGRIVAGPYAERTLERTFAFRHRRTLDDIMRHEQVPTPLHVVISGASGLIGSALRAFLSTGGHRVERLVRRKAGEGEISWDPARRELEVDSLEGVDIVCHLAGESLVGRWSKSKKQAILESRRDSTGLLAKTMARLERPPKALLVASAVGVYGSRGDELLTETSPPGSDFLA